MIILPRVAGRGTTLRSRVVEGARHSTRHKRFKDISAARPDCSPTTTKLRVRRPLHHGSLAARAPVVPSPAIAGADGASALVLATHPRPRLADHSHEFFRLKENEGRRSAGRRNCPVGPRHAADVAIHLRFGRRPRVLRDALASRRSTAALTEVSRPRLFDFRPGFLGRGSSRALPALSCPSPAAAPRAPAVIPVDMMPEAARERTVSVRARAPRPLTQSGAPS
jgi:hypothetical protein